MVIEWVMVGAILVASLLLLAKMFGLISGEDEPGWMPSPPPPQHGVQTDEFGLQRADNVPPMPAVKQPRGDNVYGIVVPSVWHHMQCRDCLRFFAVEDAPAGRDHWHCPWCGDHQVMKEAA